MKKIVILVLFLVLIAFLVIILMEPSIEKFDTNNICGFNPEGKTKLACVDRCHSQRRLKSISTIGNNYLEKCKRINCDRICDNCITESCEWTQTVNSATPLESKISGVEGNGEIKIIWLPPLSRTPIKSYTLVVTNVTPPAGGGVVSEPSTTRLNFHSDPQCTMCEHIIKGLTNGEKYNIYLISSNNMGSSPPSNILGPLTPLAEKSDFEDPTANKKSHWSDDVRNYKETVEDKKIGTFDNSYSELETLLS